MWPLDSGETPGKIHLCRVLSCFAKQLTWKGLGSNATTLWAQQELEQVGMSVGVLQPGCRVAARSRWSEM